MENKKWYVGQQVWDKTMSDEAGDVISFVENDYFPIIVKFKNKNSIGYFIDGKHTSTDRYPTLSTKPYEIIMEGFSQEVEEELPYKGQVCWGRNSEAQQWHIGHYVKQEFNHYILNTTVNDENTGATFAEITTKNPYEVEEDREPQIGDMVFAWSDLKHGFVYGELQLIESSGYPYIVKYHGGFKHCSLKNPLIK